MALDFDSNSSSSNLDKYFEAGAIMDNGISFRELFEYGLWFYILEDRTLYSDSKSSSLNLDRTCRSIMTSVL